MKLTQRQESILRYVNDFYVENRYPAVVTDIVKACGIRQETVRYNLQRLQFFGYVDWIISGRHTRAIFPLWKV